MNKLILTFRLAGGVIAVLASAVDTARGDYAIQVAWDSSPLVGHPGHGPYYIDFNTTSANTSNPTNNVFVVSDIHGMKGEGAAAATGQASGSVQDGFTLTAGSTFFNDIFQQITPGQVLGFTITIKTPIGIHGTTPDSFAFSILEGEGQDLAANPNPFALYTLAPDSSSLLTVDVRPDFPVGSVMLSSLSDISTYGSDPANADFPFSAPAYAVPEPASFALASCALGLIGVARLFGQRKDRV